MRAIGLAATATITCLAWAPAETTAAESVAAVGCEAVGMQTVPRKIVGMRPQDAVKWLEANGYKGQVTPRTLPFQTTLAGRVVSTNPYAGVTVCNGTRLWLNIGPPAPPESTVMRDVRGKGLAEALEELKPLEGPVAKRIELVACGQVTHELPAICKGQFRVHQQWPPAGTSLESRSAPIWLQLERLARQPSTGDDAYAACNAAPGLGWRFTYEPPVPLPAGLQSRVARVELRQIEPVVDGVACTARVPSIATPVFDLEPEPPGDGVPIAPVVLAGALGGGLLLRLWPWGRGGGKGVARTASPPPPTPSLRVHLDVPRVGE